MGFEECPTEQVVTFDSCTYMSTVITRPNSHHRRFVDSNFSLGLSRQSLLVLEDSGSGKRSHHHQASSSLTMTAKEHERVRDYV